MQSKAEGLTLGAQQARIPLAAASHGPCGAVLKWDPPVPCAAAAETVVLGSNRSRLREMASCCAHTTGGRPHITILHYGPHQPMGATSPVLSICCSTNSCRTRTRTYLAPPMLLPQACIHCSALLCGHDRRGVCASSTTSAPLAPTASLHDCSTSVSYSGDSGLHHVEKILPERLYITTMGKAARREASSALHA